ncbi:MAG: DUF4190 domain-containing protein [Actinomycetota bacterium]|nr:DUF4190 domain-containing protein [Actinomycetota bacterium]
MECEACGNNLKPGDKFCRQCGARLGAVPTGPDAGGETPVPEAEKAGGGKTPEAGSTPPSPEAPPPAPPGVTAHLPGTPPRGPRTSAWSVASLMLGILSFLCLPFLAAVPAVVFGALAKREIKRSGGTKGGSGMATAGLVLGIVNLSLLVISALVYIPWAIVNMDELRTDTGTVSLKGADTVVAELDIRSGTVEVKGGADQLMEGEFTYNVGKWRPEISYRVSDGKGELKVVQGGGWWVPVLWNARCDWYIKLSDGVPIDFRADLSSGDGFYHLDRLDLIRVQLGSGSGDITADLSGNQPELKAVKVDQSSGDMVLDLAGSYGSPMNLDLGTSSGDIDLDLRGAWRDDLKGLVEASSGDITLRVPGNVGVYITADTGSGDVDASGMKVKGDVYVNDAYGEAGVTLRLDVQVSSGDIRILPGD